MHVFGIALPLIHDVGYYRLNYIPTEARLSVPHELASCGSLRIRTRLANELIFSNAHEITSSFVIQQRGWVTDQVTDLVDRRVVSLIVEVPLSPSDSQNALISGLGAEWSLET
jgi:hypothetical protein